MHIVPTDLRIVAAPSHAGGPHLRAGGVDAIGLLTRLERESLAFDKLRAALEFDEARQLSISQRAELVRVR